MDNSWLFWLTIKWFFAIIVLRNKENNLTKRSRQWT